MDSAMKREIHRRRRNNLGFVASRTPLPSRQNQELRVMVNNRPGKTVSNVRKNGRFGKVLKQRAQAAPRQPNVQGFNRNKGIKPSNIRDGRVTNFGPILKGKPIKQRLPNMQGFNRNKGIKPANIRTGSVTNYRPIKQRQLTAVISKNGQFQQTMNSLKKAVRKTVECSGNREDTKTLIKSVSMIIALRG